MPAATPMISEAKITDAPTVTTLQSNPIVDLPLEVDLAAHAVEKMGRCVDEVLSWLQSHDLTPLIRASIFAGRVTKWTDFPIPVQKDIVKRVTAKVVDRLWLTRLARFNYKLLRTWSPQALLRDAVMKATFESIQDLARL